MGREVAVAEPEPGLSAECLDRPHEGPGLAAAAPAGLGILEARKGVHDGVEVGRDMQAQMLEIVAGVDAEHEPVRRARAIKPECELGAAHAAADREDGPFAHRKRSSSLVRRSALAGAAARSPQSSPCTSTAGRRSPACPMTSEAAAAISSASAICVTRSLLPKRYGSTTMSTSDGRPAAPSATPTTPFRQARPKLSLMTTPTETPKCASSRRLSSRQLASGSVGKSSTRSPPT